MERRESPQRYQIEASAVLRVHGKAGPFLVTILDVSATGVRLSSPTPFTPGTMVTITCRGASMTGEIRYARNVEDYEFHVGVRVDQASEGAMLEDGSMDLTRLFPKSLASSKASKLPSWTMV
jgi:hypothetical protein